MKSEDDSQIKKKPNLTTDTDMHYELLADPTKLKPREKVINIPRPIDEYSDDSSIIDHSTFNSKVRSNSKKSSASSVASVSSKKSSSSRKSKKSSSRKSSTSSTISRKSRKSSNVSTKSSQSKKNIQQNVQQNVQQTINPPKKPEINNPFPSIYLPNDDKSLKFKKMELLAKLYDIQKAGRTLTRQYNINSEIEDMEMEIRYQTDLENKKNSVNLCKSFLLNATTAIEFLNDRYDPFGLQLRGWGDQMKLNIDNYNDVFGELYEKYKGSGRKIEPEVKFIFMFTASIASFHATKTLTKSIGIESVIKQNPDLMQKLQSTLTGTIEKNISNSNGNESKSNQDIQKEMYKKMMEEKAKQNVTMKKPSSLADILNKVKTKVPPTTNNKYEESSQSEKNRIQVTDTIDSESTASEININSFKKINKMRKSINKI